MKAAVIGLGVEGKKAVNSLLKHGWDVYASDLNSNIDLSDLSLPGISLNFLEGGETFSIVSDTLTLDLGFTNSQAIDECDAIAISPSMYGGSFATKLLSEGNLLSDVVSNHKKIFSIGITGTNGKTTTVHMLKSILENAGYKVGLIGTIETIIGDKHIPANNTTPESYIVQEYFAEMLKAGCQICVMEVSSQGLMMHRTAGIPFELGIFTNLAPDHIGPNEHASFEEYAQCKGMLFKQCKVGIANADDENFEMVMKDHTCTLETIGFSEKADLRPSETLC